MQHFYKIILGFLLLLNFHLANAQTSTLVSIGADGKLVYAADNKGNKVPDFSGVGYMNSEAPIPTALLVKTVYPVSGDNRANVQNAIDSVSQLPLGSDGLRGAILFKSGTYNISDTIKISASGIVLRGEGSNGSGTNFIATKISQYSLFYFSGKKGIDLSQTSKKAIVDSYVPFGTNQITVESGHTFQNGDKVVVHKMPKQSWIDLLTMAQWGWTPESYDVYFERKVKAVNGNILTLDAPMVDIIDTTYATGEVMRYASNRIEKCGIENMRISSTYVSETDENHGWEAVTFYNIINAWARNLEVYYFGYSAVHVLDGAAWVTVQDCKMLDPKSIIDGGRRYSFNIDGQRCLVQNCFTRNGRHDFVNGSRTPGPVVFYNCSATLQKNDIGPHHRWSTGILYDNIDGDGRIDVQNRTSSGSGHGWAAAQTMFWNCTGDRMVIQDPQGDFRNWAVGCIFNEVTNIGDMTTEPLGFVESSGTPITSIPSLFTKQLNERLTPLRQNQTVTFNALTNKLISEADFNAGAVASSGYPIVYSSSNPSVATIVNGLIHIVGPGNTIITASQPGDTYAYNAATNVSQSLTIVSVYAYSPDTSSTVAGNSCKCTFGNLQSNDGLYHIVNSTKVGTRSCDWYAIFNINQNVSSITKLTVNVDANYNTSKTQNLYLYNWNTATWSSIDSRTISTSDVLTTVELNSFAAFISSAGEIRVRVFTSGGNNNYNCNVDWMQLLVESNGTGRFAQPTTNTFITDAAVYADPVNHKIFITCKALKDTHVSISVSNDAGNIMQDVAKEVDVKAGNHTIELPSVELANGQYDFIIKAGNFSQKIKYTFNN